MLPLRRLAQEAASQHCCCYARCQSESVLAGSSGDGGRQLQLDYGSAGLFAVWTVGGRVADLVFVQHWILDYVHFTFLFVIFCLLLFVSHPLLAFGLGGYWFWISLYVYDRNMTLAPILRQRRCSLVYDVYLTCKGGDV
jgi:hypothetical protein